MNVMCGAKARTSNSSTAVWLNVCRRSRQVFLRRSRHAQADWNRQVTARPLCNRALWLPLVIVDVAVVCQPGGGMGGVLAERAA